ncbi:MAG TPA: hypothetical protein VMV23_02765, partial [Candidatus Nanopelagicaceae bacterium]|nr:hypothetical protein [Candidatus Nanopelagicaceae bacterium]
MEAEAPPPGPSVRTSWGVREVVLGIVVAVPAILVGIYLVIAVTLGLHQAGVIPHLSGPSWQAAL